MDGPKGQCDLEINVMTETKTSKATERETLEEINIQVMEADGCLHMTGMAY